MTRENMVFLRFCGLHLVTWSSIRSLRKSVLELLTKLRYTTVSVLCKVLGTLRSTYIWLGRVFRT
jgi:hypothetical protein